MSTVTEEVKNDAEIRLIGFGTFKKNQRAARKGRNPQTGEVIDIAASESLAFKSSVKY
ncbi:HU family DNA-binding protein [Selenomonas ruminantium]|uniref:HU family DNA-binding protein n=1 Tax=Selenomonas ruminantium TaxID=971 RepID=UPI003531DFB3